ncbi:MAG: hypothetical protein QG574_4990 [Cyanobacteriota bacterium erpe_2018_sw_21hr_WHONDRS-SW48-000092_B_bin.40]|nr:hypothetical protein [Cyanobacteriota bacterium erpe_2018_sw_21hr_WHONDRS-SW48-000092_B_bin.40]
MTDESNYDNDLAIALSLDLCLEAENNNSLISKAGGMAIEFRNDMVELGQKIRSACSKIAALILMPEEMIGGNNGQDNQLQFSAILIETPDISLALAEKNPPSLPVSMVKNLAAEAKKRDDTTLLKMELKQQLLWFQEYGRNGLLSTAAESETAQSSGSRVEKTKRHLTLITDHIQAA